MLLEFRGFFKALMLFDVGAVLDLAETSTSKKDIDFFIRSVFIKNLQETPRVFEFSQKYKNLRLFWISMPYGKTQTKLGFVWISLIVSLENLELHKKHKSFFDFQRFYRTLLSPDPDSSMPTMKERSVRAPPSPRLPWAPHRQAEPGAAGRFCGPSTLLPWECSP